MANIRQYRYPFNLYHLSIGFFLALTISTETIAAAQDLLPNLCDSYKCPPISEIICPDDSKPRETLSQADANLLETITATPTEPFYNMSQYDDELYVQCCLSKKCVCKTCHIPDCHGENEVVVEVMPETMLPGNCCGQYECHPAPNCTEVKDTDNFWLTDCQRCKCFSGDVICHQSCDEVNRKQTAICKSKSQNEYFEHGDTWKEGCDECECYHGEIKCVTSFCRSINCPVERQITLKDKCCPICWPKGRRMPSDDDDDNSEDYDDDYDEDVDDPVSGIPVSNHYGDHSFLEPLPTINPDSKEVKSESKANKHNENSATDKPETLYKNTNANATSTMSSTSTTEAPLDPSSSPKSITHMNTTNAPLHPDNHNSIHVTESGQSASPDQEDNDSAASGSNGFGRESAPPCKTNLRDSTATYQLYPEVVTVVPDNPNFILYVLIFILCILVVSLLRWNCLLRAKKRSYRPVDSSDDNFNKMPSKIKKTNENV